MTTNSVAKIEEDGAEERVHERVLAWDTVGPVRQVLVIELGKLAITCEGEQRELFTGEMLRRERVAPHRCSDSCHVVPVQSPERSPRARLPSPALRGVLGVAPRSW